MLLEPVDTAQDGVTSGKDTIQRTSFTGQLLPLIGNTDGERTAAGSKFKQFFVHSRELLRNCAMSASSSDRLLRNSRLGDFAC